MNDSHAQAPQPEAVLENVGWVRSLALQIAGHGPFSEDVAQETWVRVLRNPPPEGVLLRDWIVGTAKRVTMELRRQAKRRVERERKVAAERERESQGALHRQVAIEVEVVERVMGLEEPYRGTVLARYFEHRSVREIAADDGVSESAVRTRLSQAYGVLRAQLTERKETAAGAFFCLATADVAPASGALAGASAARGVDAVVWKCLLAAAGLVGVAALGSLVLGSGEPASTVAVPVASEALAAAPVEPGPVGETEDGPSAGPRRSIAAAGSSLAAPSTAPGPSPSPGAEAAGELESLRIEVVDGQGRAVNDVPVVLRPRGSDARSIRFLRERTGAAGEPALFQLEEFLGQRGVKAARLEALVAGVGIATEPVPVDVSQAQAAPTRIVLAGPYGSVRFECVDPKGVALDQEVSLLVTSGSALVDSGASRLIVPRGGELVLRPVALGAEFSCMASPRRGWTSQLSSCTGPVSDGETVSRRVTFIYPRYHVAFELASRPTAKDSLGNVEVTLSVEGQKSEVDRIPWSPDGRVFAATFGGTAWPGRSAIVQIRSRPALGDVMGADGAQGARSAEIPVILNGLRDTIDLGTVSLELEDASARGRVLDREGEPVFLAEVALFQWKVDAGVTGWHRVLGHRVVTARDGTFPPFAPADEGRYALVASVGDERTSVVTPFEPGGDPVELVLRAATTVRGELLVSDGADLRKLEVRLVGADVEAFAVAKGRVQADGSFELRHVMAEQVRLTVGRRGTVGILHSLDDVRVGGSNGQVADARLTPWDLRDRMRVIHVRVETPDGEPADNAVVRTGYSQGFTTNGLLSLAVPFEPAGITVNRTGYRQFTGRTDALPEVIRLRKPLAVQLEIHAGPRTRALLDTMVVALYSTDTLSSDELELLGEGDWLREASKHQWSRRRPIVVGEATSLGVHQPGEYYLRFRERVGEAGDRRLDRAALPAELREARVNVEDVEGVQTFRFDWPE